MRSNPNAAISIDGKPFTVVWELGKNKNFIKQVLVRPVSETILLFFYC
jgi:hypothetical protein